MTAMFNFIHAADLHLDSPLRGLSRHEGAPVEAIRGATRRAFEHLTALAIEESVAFVLLAGDLYDGDWRDYNTGLFFNRQMALLHEAGIPVFVVAGNHDAASQLTRSLRPPPNVRVFSTRHPESHELEPLGVCIHGQGFASRSVDEDLTRRYPPARPGLFNIGLLHTSLDGRPGHADYAPCTVEGLRALGYQYWALGHVHRREEVSRSPWIIYPGNIQGRHARETGPKGCTLVSVSDGRVTGVEHRELDVVRWAQLPVALQQLSDMDALYERLRQELAQALEGAGGRLLAVRLRLQGASTLDKRLRADPEAVLSECRALADTLAPGGIWVEKLALETRAAVSTDAALAREDAFGELLRGLHDLELDGTALDTLAESFAPLRQKLPAVLREGEEGFDPASHAAVVRALTDVKALLLQRLIDGEA